MKTHTKLYIDKLGYNLTDYMPSEISGRKGVDIHHIINRENRIENLMLLTREEHLDHGEIKKSMVFLLETHRNFLNDNGVVFDNKWFEFNINKYRSLCE